MKSKALIIGAFSSIILLNPTASRANSLSLLTINPYGGVDIGMQHFGFKSGYGDNLFAKNLPKGNLFVGINFNNYFGLEGGYESTIEKKRNATLYGGNSTMLGNFIPGGPNETDYLNLNSKAKISGWHLGITGRFPIDTKNLFIIGHVGIKRTNIKLVSRVISYKDYGQPEELGTPQDQVVLGDNSKKNILKLSGGIEYFFNKHIGLRAMLGWENTAKLKPVSDNKTALLKNSFLYSIGITLK